MGEVKTGIGGGICQLANLLYWMALHTPLIVTERHQDIIIVSTHFLIWGERLHLEVVQVFFTII
nr:MULTISPECIES: VanW family protein [Lysinibacillus]